VKFYCIADEDTVRGLRLAGVAGQAVATAQEAAAALATAAADRELGILILTQNVAASIRASVDTHRLERAQPLIVEIPGPTGPLAGHKSLRQVVQAAVGISVGADDAG
jgi:V/A-type H+-transporting ATPase subunit F